MHAGSVNLFACAGGCRWSVFRFHCKHIVYQVILCGDLHLCIFSRLYSDVFGNCKNACFCFVVVPFLKCICLCFIQTGQLVVCTMCTCVMQTKQIWLFSAHLLPLVARLCLVPLEAIVFINRFAMIFTGLEVIYFLASNLLVPYNLAKNAYRELAQVFCTSSRRIHLLLKSFLVVCYFPALKDVYCFMCLKKK